MNNKYIKLKLCPFCNNKAKLIKSPDGTTYDIACKTDSCYLEYGADWYLTKRQVSSLWNNRPSRWISIVDRPPKDGESVNVYIVANQEFVALLTWEDESWWYEDYEFSSLWKPIPKSWQIIAWQYLPEF